MYYSLHQLRLVDAVLHAIAVWGPLLQCIALGSLQLRSGDRSYSASIQFVTFAFALSTRKGQPLPGTFTLSREPMELTPIRLNRLSGICRVRLRFPGDLTLSATGHVAV